MAYDLLRIAVSRICGADPASLTIGRTEHGKPFFVERRDIHFSISHAGEYILIAIGSEPLGVDIEQRRVISYEKIGRRIMTDPEYEAFLEREDCEAEFYRKWVLMESYVKWTGLGMFGEIKGLPMNGWGRRDKGTSDERMGHVPLYRRAVFRGAPDGISGRDCSDGIPTGRGRLQKALISDARNANAAAVSSLKAADLSARLTARDTIQINRNLTKFDMTDLQSEVTFHGRNN